MEKTKIDWCDSSWNPISGCYHNCEYCYARSIATRFGKNLPDFSYFAVQNKGLHLLDNKIDKTAYPFGFEPTFYSYRLGDYINKKGRSIFVCSMSDLFGEWVPLDWIKTIFEYCLKAPQHTYLFLTKNPKRYLELIKSGDLVCRENMWYGVTATKNDDIDSISDIIKSLKFYNESINLFISAEPLHEDISNRLSTIVEFLDLVIVGAETGNRKDKIVPKKEWIDNLCEICKNTSLFMKSSLNDIYENLITQLPYKNNQVSSPILV